MVLPYIQTWTKGEKIKSPEINPYMYVQLLFDKRSCRLNGEMIVASINGIGKIGFPHATE